MHIGYIDIWPANYLAIQPYADRQPIVYITKPLYSLILRGTFRRVALSTVRDPFE